MCFYVKLPFLSRFHFGLPTLFNGQNSVLPWNTVCTVKNEKFTFSHSNFFSSNQLFSNFFSKTVAFTKFLPIKATKVLKNAITQNKFPWNQLFSNFFSKNVDLTEKHRFSDKNVDAFWQKFRESTSHFSGLNLISLNFLNIVISKFLNLRCLKSFAFTFKRDERG